MGNLPFSVDSAQLADLFGSVGVVEMVEVYEYEISPLYSGLQFVVWLYGYVQYFVGVVFYLIKA